MFSSIDNIKCGRGDLRGSTRPKIVTTKLRWKGILSFHYMMRE